ncbi:hypothetical protein J4470_00760 [Candidatus Woesearchaeota archaeon]|nr:hypothetical protein [Candidatus Woesearchaeota archaeon]
MAKVIITALLEGEINKKFKRRSVEVFSLLRTLEDNPYKGKEVGVVGRVLIKEIKYGKFRFYFITDGYKIKVLKARELKELIIKFVRMSEKKDQQETIEEIKNVLRSLGEEGF